MLYELLEQEIRLLDARESDPERPFWFIDYGDNGVDESITYCYDCLHEIKPDANIGEDFIGGGYSEHDSPERCSHCGKILQYVLTDYGVQQELIGFYEYGFDWSDPDECFELARVAHGIFKNETQSETLLKILRAGAHHPAPESAVSP